MFASRALVAVTLTACIEPHETDAPDMAALVSAYASPTGTFDRAPTTVAKAEARLDALGGGFANVALANTITTALVLLDTRPIWTNPHTTVHGTLHFEVACGPPGSRIELDVAVVDGRVSRAAWGRAHRCALFDETFPGFDGDLRIHLYGGGDLLLALEGELRNIPGRADERVSLDFQIIDGRLETRLPPGIVVARTRGDLDVRAANGRFRCDLARQTCR